MKHIRIRHAGMFAVFAALLLALSLAAIAAPPDTIVNEDDLGGDWIVDFWDTDGAGVVANPSYEFSNPAVALPGYGISALNMKPGDGVGGSGCSRVGGKAFLGTQSLNGVELDDIDELTFSYLVEVLGYSHPGPVNVRNNANLSPYINIFVERNGTAGFQGGDTILIYEPLYTRGNGFVVQNTWYTDNPIGASGTGAWHTAGAGITGVSTGSSASPTWAQIMELDADTVAGGIQRVGDLTVVNPTAGCDGTSNEGTGSGLVIAIGQKSGEGFAGMSVFIDGVILEVSGDSQDVNLTTSESLTATGGDAQTTDAGFVFGTPLQVTLLDLDGQPIEGETVEFSAPISGASATFPNGSTAVTNASGIASVVAVANSTTGVYSVTALADGRTATFSLENVASAAYVTEEVFPEDINSGGFWTTDVFNNEPMNDVFGEIARNPAGVVLPGYGASSFLLNVGPGAGDPGAPGGCDRLGGKVFLGTTDLAGVALKDVKGFSYSFLFADTSIDFNYPAFLNIYVDLNGNGQWESTDSILVYDPSRNPNLPGPGTRTANTWYDTVAIGADSTGGWITSAAAIPGVPTLASNQPGLTWNDIVSTPYGAGTVGDLLIANPEPGCDDGGSSDDEGTATGFNIQFGQKNGGSYNNGEQHVDKVGLYIEGEVEPTTFDFTFVACSTDCYVSPTGADHNSGADPANALKTINAAVNAVDAGGTVHVAAGSYAEQVTIGKSLTLSGADEATTVIQMPTTGVVRLPGNNVYQVLVNNGATVNVSDLTVSGPHLSYVGGDRFIAVRVLGNATANLTDISVLNTHVNATANGNQTGNGIYYGEVDAGLATVSTGSGTLTDVTVSNFQKTAIVVAGVGSHIIVDGGLIEEGTVFDWSAVIAQNGIQVGYGSTAAVSGTTINDLHCTIPSTGSSGCFPDYFVSSGFLLYSAGSGTTIDGVTLNNTGVSIYAYDSGATTVTDAVINNSLRNAIVNDSSTLTVSDTTITGGWEGVSTYASAADHTTTMTGSSITNTTGTAFLVEETGAGVDAGSSINSSNITGNADGVAYDGTGSIDATCNWWGAPTGPSGEGSGSGDAVSAGVTFAPWLIASAPGGECVALETPFKIVKVSGDEQSTPVETQFADPLVVRVVDVNDNPIEGVSVQFAVLTRAASATFTPADGVVVTDASGEASIIATADDEVGSYDVIVTAGPVFASFTLTNDPDTVATPVLTATAAGGTKIDVSWTGAFTVADTFELFRSPDNVTFTSIATPANGTLVYNDTGLTCGTEYWYRLDVTNAAGTASSNIDSATTNTCDELLANGSFEASLSGTWTPLNKTGDKRKTGADAFDGTAYLLYKPSANENSQYSQSISDISALTTGDTLSLSAWLKSGAASPKLKIALKINYASGKVKIPLVNFTTTSAAYTEVTASYVLTETPTKVVLQLQNKTKSGKVYVDLVSLTVNDLGSRGTPIVTDSPEGILPPPQAPDGFRGNN